MAFQPLNSNGQKTMANSSPVVIASDQSAIPVSASSLPLPTGAATATKQDTGNTSVASIDTKTPALGQALAAGSVPVVLTAAQLTTLTPPAAITGYALDTTITTTNTEIGSLTETAPTTDTASSGLNGRLQRIAQRITSLIALLPTALGAGGGLKIDGSGTPLPISGTVTAMPAVDIAPATQNITVVDSSSSTATGANGQSIVIGTPTAGSAGSFALSSVETIRVEVTGIWTGTLTAEQSIDGGITWTSQGLHQGAYTTSSFIAGFIGGCNVSGATNFRMRATSAITGTAVIKVIESLNTQSVYIANAAPAGTVISILNSSSTTLTSGSVFTGTGEDVSNFSEMRISVFADVASATDGLSIQQSTNNTNWDIIDTYTIPALSAGQGKTFVVPRQARYYRIVYTNGGTNQTAFRLQSILNRTATAPSSNRASDGYTNETDLVQNQVFPMGYNGSTWDRLRSVLTGNMKTDMSSVAGTATSVGNGTTDAGTIRVTLSSDGTGQVKLAAGSAVIGHVITDTGSTTVVTGNVTAVQPTGTNLHVVTDSTSTTAVTQPTAANLNATVIGAGTAGTANSGVVTIQGIASMTKLLVTPDSVALPANQSVNVAQVNGVTTSTGTGATGAGSQRVTVATDTATVAGSATLPAGANIIGKVGIDQTTPGTTNGVSLSQINTTATFAGNGTAGAGAQRVTIASDNTAFQVIPTPGTAGGWSKIKYTAQTTTVQTPKGTAGTFGGYFVYNPNATVAYVQVFDVATATTVTLGTTVPDMVFGIPATSGANLEIGNGVSMINGIKLACTTTATGLTAPGTGLDMTIFYK